LGSAVFHYLGPSFAVLLFARVDVLGVAWMRIASAAVVFAVWRRPWRKFAALDRGGQLLSVALGAVFAVMNVCFYISIDRLPLATVAAIEFIGPIILALIGARIGRNFAAVAAAGAGVYLLTHVRFAGEPAGIAFALANAAVFAAYIVLAHRVARRSAGCLRRSFRMCSTSWQCHGWRARRMHCSWPSCPRRRLSSASSCSGNCRPWLT
jgi:inner membrane transporter RhtA